MCDGKKLVCSNSRGVNIPQEFCKDIFNCECISSKDCSPGCNCISSTCYSNNGTRKTTTIKVKKPQKLLIIFSIICIITFPLIFYFLYKETVHKGKNKKRICRSKRIEAGVKEGNIKVNSSILKFIEVSVFPTILPFYIYLENLTPSVKIHIYLVINNLIIKM